MKLSELLAGRSNFSSKSEIIKFVENSVNFDQKKENLAQANALMIFSTSKQQTWLVSTTERLYCILDDIRKEKPHINWSISRSKIFSGGRFVLNIQTHNKSGLTGLVDIGQDHKDWYFTRSLFSTTTIENSIQQLIESQMGPKNP